MKKIAIVSIVFLGIVIFLLSLHKRPDDIGEQSIKRIYQTGPTPLDLGSVCGPSTGGLCVNCEHEQKIKIGNDNYKCVEGYWVKK